jgi:hypothetical protein
MFKCFETPDQTHLLDVMPFKMKHKLLGHPTLTIESLSKILPEIESNRVMYSKGLSDLGINFDRAHFEHKNGLSLQETIERLKDTSSFIAVKGPQVHPAFKEIFNDLIDDVSALMRIRGTGNRAIEPTLWLFIASPNAMTPFHFDRYSNFIMQMRGSKELAIFPPLDQRVISAENYEAYMDRSEQRPPWNPEMDHLAKKFDFQPGDMVHIPYTGGHYVKNGPEDISISLSIFFQTNETLKLTNAMRINHRLRKRGMSPTFVGVNPKLDAFKSSVLPVADLIGATMGRLRNTFLAKPQN